jgi:hypothetical protein
LIPLLCVVLAFLIRARERQKPRDTSRDWHDPREQEAYMRRWDRETKGSGAGI